MSRRTLRLRWWPLLGLLAGAWPAQAADYTVEELREIGDRCRQTQDFNACLDRVLQERARPPIPVRPAPPPERFSAPPMQAPAPPAGPAPDPACAELARYRDGELFEQWQAAVKRAPKGRVFQEARADLQRLRAEIASDAQVADAVQAAKVLSQTVKLTTDLIMDLLKLHPPLTTNPAAQAVFKVYDKANSKIDASEIERRAEKVIKDALTKAYPKVGNAVKALVNLTRNTQRLMEMGREPQLRRELEAHIEQIDRLLVAYDTEIRQGPQAWQAIEAVRRSIDARCHQGRPGGPALRLD